MSNISDNIRELLNSDSMDDNELAIMLLDSDKVDLEDKKEYIRQFLEENKDSFSDIEIRLLKAWVDFDGSIPGSLGFLIQNYYGRKNMEAYLKRNRGRQFNS